MKYIEGDLHEMGTFDEMMTPKWSKIFRIMKFLEWQIWEHLKQR
jgi:hypothetical protein